MLHLLIIEDSVDMGGVQHSTLNLLKESIHDSAIQITLLLPDNGPLQEYCLALGINYYIYTENKKKASSISLFNNKVKLPNLAALVHTYFSTLMKAKVIAEIIQKNSITADIILTKGMYSHISGAIVARRSSIPVIWHVQDYITEKYGGLYRKFFSYLANKYCTFLIADGKPIKDALSGNIKQKTCIVNNGVDVKSFYYPDEQEEHKKELGYAPNHFLIGNVARIVSWKGQLNLVKAFHSVMDDMPDARLILVGSPLFGSENYLNEIKTFIAANKLDDRIKITGYINDLTHLYSALDIFAYPATEKDTCPLALLGAMASGTPIIATKIDGIYEVINEAEDITFYPKDDIAALAALMVNAYKNRTNKKTNFPNHTYALNHFDNPLYYQSIKSIIKNTIVANK